MEGTVRFIYLFQKGRSGLFFLCFFFPLPCGAHYIFIDELIRQTANTLRAIFPKS